MAARSGNPTALGVVALMAIAGATSITLAGCGDDKSGASAGRPTREFTRIVVVGASVSAGFGGMPVGDSLTAAVPKAKVTSVASPFLFRDAVHDGGVQIDDAITARADLVVALDFLFWHAYHGHDRENRLERLDRGLADLERARAAGAAIIVGDIPRFTTASEMFLPKEAIPPAAELEEVNTRLRAWAAFRADVLVVPLASWTEPLARGGFIEVTPGERVRGEDLMSIDGLHPNPEGLWYVMTRIDALAETAFHVPENAWTFKRP